MSCLLLSWHASSRECVFFVKQKTAYELRISDWSSDVCSSDLCDRGGQVPYHGPGQVMAYCLVDLRRMKLFVKEYVALLEDVIIQVLGALDLAGARSEERRVGKEVIGRDRYCWSPYPYKKKKQFQLPMKYLTYMTLH